MENNKEFKSTSEKLNEISQEMFGKNYEEIMNLGRITNGAQGYYESKESKLVFDEYLKRNAINHWSAKR